MVLAAFLNRLKLSLEEVDLQMLQDACGYLENQAGAIHFAKDFHAVLQSFKFHTKDSKCLIFRLKSIGQSFCFMIFPLFGNNFCMDNLEEFFRSDLGMSTGRWPPEGSAKIFSELLRRDTNGTNGEGLELLRRAHSLDEKDTEMLS